MPWVPYTLKQETTFSRFGSNATLTLSAGENVQREEPVCETEHERIHRVRTTRNGFLWQCERRVLKNGTNGQAGQQHHANTMVVGPGVVVTTPSPMPPAQPVMAHAVAAVDKTTAATGRAVERIGMRQAGVIAGGAATADEQRCRGLSKVAEQLLSGGVYMLIYDIPVVLNDQCPNPSPRFRPLGFRLNDSCWVMPQSSLDSCVVKDEMALWDDAEGETVIVAGLNWTSQTKVEYYTIKYDPSEIVKLREIARTKLAKELVRIHTSLIECIDAASERLNAANALLAKRVEAGEDVTEREQARPGDAYAGSLRASVRAASSALEDCLKSAEAFDEYGNLTDLFNAVRASVHANTIGVNAILRQQGRKGV